MGNSLMQERLKRVLPICAYIHNIITIFIHYLYLHINVICISIMDIILMYHLNINYFDTH